MLDKIDVEVFRNSDEMLKALEEKEHASQRAWEESIEVQRVLKPGDYYARLTSWGLLIVGRIIPPTSLHDSQLLEAQPWLRLVRAWSRVCTNGESGSEHVAVMIPIDRDTFDRCRKKGFEPTVEVRAVIGAFWDKMKNENRSQA